MDIEVVMNLMKKFNEALKEAKILYEINTPDEMMYLTHIVVEASSMGAPPDMIVKLLKAAAYFIETTDNITTEFIKEMK